MGGLVKQQDSKALIVELIGTPAAGKSTLLPAIKDYFRQQAMQPWSVIEAARPFARRTPLGRFVNAWAPARLRSPLLWQVFYQHSRLHRTRFHREHRAFMDALLRFQRQRPIPEADRRHVLHWFTNLTGQYGFLKEHSQTGEVLIFDEGFVHRVVQLFASEAEPVDAERIHSYLRQVPVPDLVIQPRASVETCVERVYLRGVWKRFKGRDKAVVTRFIANAYVAVNIAVDFMLTEGWPVVQVLNENRPASEAVHALSRQLSSKYQFVPNKALLSMNA
jgi:thymidylate kinase